MKTKKNTIKAISATIMMSFGLFMLTACDSNKESAGMSNSNNPTIDQVGNVDAPDIPIDGGADIAVITSTPKNPTMSDLRAVALNELDKFAEAIKEFGNCVGESYAVRETDTQYGLFVVQRNPLDPDYFSAWMIKVEIDASGKIVVGWYYSSHPTLTNPKWDDYNNYAGASYWNVT